MFKGKNENEEGLGGWVYVHTLYFVQSTKGMMEAKPDLGFSLTNWMIRRDVLSCLLRDLLGSFWKDVGDVFLTLLKCCGQSILRTYGWTVFPKKPY